MFTYADCARMAQSVYDVTSGTPDTSSGRAALTRVAATLVQVFNDDSVQYHAAIWQKAGWMAFVVRGTVPQHVPNLVQDALMKLMDGVPYDLVKRAVHDIEGTLHPAAGQRWIVVGHSLGGSVAQILGFLYGVPFVTFDAPGMRYDVMRRGWAKMIARQTGGIGSTALSITPGVRDTYNWAVRETPQLDQSYEAARAGLARSTGEQVSNGTSTAIPDPDRELGFNIAHSKDTIHALIGPPIGHDYVNADFTPALNWIPPMLGNVSAAASITSTVSDVLRYHDMGLLADYIAARNWGSEAPVDAMKGRDGRWYYYAKHYASSRGWEQSLRTAHG